jgi:catechol 2,3-dioxygenase-like lactoylglutathione lyase family enzyme
VIGRFLEFSVGTADIRASLEFYGRLGFSQADVGEAWSHPYAVLTDGRVCLGLHEEADFAPSMTFVKPELLKQVDRLEQLGVEFEVRRLGNDVFNELGWRDPSGHLIRLLEARTFSPGKRRAVDTSLCGYFVEIALPSPGIEAAKQHWESLGFVGMDEPDAPLPHVSCTSDTVDVGLYDPAHLRGPALRFDVGDVAGALARLELAGVKPGRRVPPPLQTVLAAPEGTLILLTAGDGY